MVSRGSGRALKAGACSPRPGPGCQDSRACPGPLGRPERQTLVPPGPVPWGYGHLPPPGPAVSPLHSSSFSSPHSRSGVPEKEDGAECPGSTTEPGGDHVQPARVPGDTQVRASCPLSPIVGGRACDLGSSVRGRWASEQCALSPRGHVHVSTGGAWPCRVSASAGDLGFVSLSWSITGRGMGSRSHHEAQAVMDM